MDSRSLRGIVACMEWCSHLSRMVWRLGSKYPYRKPLRSGSMCPSRRGSTWDSTTRLGSTDWTFLGNTWLLEGPMKFGISKCFLERDSRWSGAKYFARARARTKSSVLKIFQRPRRHGRRDTYVGGCVAGHSVRHWVVAGITLRFVGCDWDSWYVWSRTATASESGEVASSTGGLVVLTCWTVVDIDVGDDGNISGAFWDD
jgi:hypothetical protein